MRVGTSIKKIIYVVTDRDHPHACGDKLIMLNGAMAKLGSSPCVWGQATDFVSSLTKLRIIPMRVGTRVIFQLKMALEKDHPHACGDKRISLDSFIVRAGSSPCVWGQV